MKSLKIVFIMSVGATVNTGDVAVTPVIERLQLRCQCNICFTRAH